MRALVGADGSDHAVEAARRGLSLLASPAEVTVVGVVEVGPAPTASGLTGSFAGPLAPETAWAQVRAAAAEAVERTVGALPPATASAVERRVESGEVGPLLCHLAGELAAGAVVVGSCGRGVVRRALLGSVSDHVVRRAPCPVLVVWEAGEED